ncbi:anoctamin-10-like isoform X2 [Watersipora subatra]
MKKRCLDGTLQVFKKNNCRLFQHHDDLKKFFTVAERQRLIYHELTSIKVETENLTLPGLSEVTLQIGISFLKQCEHLGIVSQIFPLHDKSLTRLESIWYKSASLFRRQPLNEITEYYGETVGMYFAFLDYYTSSLRIPAAVGFIFYWFEFHKTSLYSLIILAAFNLIWSTAFLESWKRRANGLAYKWGTTDINIIEEARPEYYGKLAKNPITDKVEPRYPKWKTIMRMSFISLPIVLFCLAIGFAAMLAYFEGENATIAWYASIEEPGYYHDAVSFVPTIVYSLAIIIMNQIFRPLAVRLNEWENHRLQSSFDYHLVIKLVLFWFINTFMLFFYTAFYQQDLVALRTTVLTELIVTQAVDQLQETVLPYVMYKWRKRSLVTLSGTVSNSDGVQGLASVRRSEREAIKDPYEGTFDDFLELFIQYGYVTLFSCVSPLAALLSLINNHIELRTDAVKLCRIHQRPFAKPAAGIGAWETVFETMSYIAIITNSAIIGLCIYKQKAFLPDISGFYLLLFVMALEHLLIIIRTIIARVIPDAPKWVQIAAARDAYRLKTKFLALQEELVKNKKE